MAGTSESSNVRKRRVFHDDYDHEVNKNKDTSNNDDGPRISVLVVDDDTSTRKLNELLLTLSGLEVQGVENGQDAVELHCDGTSFDLILMDNDMPVKNGYEATMELRNMGVYGAIVGLTSSDEDETVIKNFMKAGLDHCIRKPLTHDKIEPFITAGKPFNHNNNIHYQSHDEDDDDDDEVISSCSSSNVIN